MRRTLLTLAAVIGLTAATALPATAATPTPTQAVSYATFVAVTNTISPCEVSGLDVSRSIPTPAAIALEATRDFRTGYHSILGGGYGLINAGAYPGNVLQSNYVRSGVYPPHQYDVWVPGYAGRSCTSWVHLVTQG